MCVKKITYIIFSQQEKYVYILFSLKEKVNNKLKFFLIFHHKNKNQAYNIGFYCCVSIDMYSIIRTVIDMENNNNYSVFAKRLLLLRERKGLSRTELGEKIGFDGIQGNKNVHKYENDLAKPGVDVLVQLAKALECSTDYLLGVTDNPNRFTGDVNNAHYELEISENEKDKPYSKEQFKKLIEKLESVGFDVNKLMND